MFWHFKEMAPQKRIAVIGAGPSGLTAIKACKEETIDAVCFERNGEAGGLWRYHDEDIDGVASVMKTTIINTSKEVGAFSDFPPPKEFPNYMHNSLMYEYFMKYAENFDLLKHIRYHMEVTKVERAHDYEDTGQWLVSAKNNQTGEIEEQTFDGVMICVGHHVYPKVPKFPGQEKFKGEILHTHSLKTCERFSNKRVAVVGIGNSGVDAAVDSAYVARQVYLSTRRGSWIMGRVGKNGLPLDFEFANRTNILLNSFLKFDTICDYLENDLNKKFDHELYNLKPKHRVLSAHPTVSDNLPNCIISGKVKVKSNIKKFEEYGVVFESEDDVTEVDVVIFATGYEIKFPFLKEDINVTNNKVNLYKYSIPSSLNHKSLAIIGNIQPVGPIFPIAEMQSRWFIQLFKGNVKFPSKETMEKEIRQKNEANSKRYVDSTRHTVQVDFVPFMDELAEQIDVKPNFLKMAITDPTLFHACMFSAATPYHYRLTGPHKWSGARDAILKIDERVQEPFNTGAPYCKQLQKKNAGFKPLTLISQVVTYITVVGLLAFRKFFQGFGYV